MIDILLLILKILLIILGSIIGLVLVLIILLLLVPIRYRAKVSSEPEFNAKAGIGWLLHIVNVGAGYENSELKCVLRVFGIPIKRINKGFGKSINDENAEGAEEFEEVSESMEEPEESVEAPVKVNTKSCKREKTEANVRKEVSRKTEAKEHPGTDQKDIKPEDKKPEDTKPEDIKPKGKKPKDTKPEDIKPEGKKPKDAKTEDVKPENAKPEDTKTEDTKPEDARSEDTKAEDNGAGKLEKLLAKLEYIYEHATSERVLKFISFALKKAVKALKAIAPRRYRGNVTFGFSDPRNTGRLLAVLAAVYPVYAKSLQIEPDFENEVFSGNLKLSGHIRLGTLLMIALRVLLCKNFKVFKKELSAISEKIAE